MPRLFLSFLLSLAISFAQSSGMRWIDPPEHSLGTYRYSPGNTTWIRDTLRFVNTLPEPLVITRLHVAGPERFSCTWTTAPGDTGYIWFEERARYGSYVESHEVRLNVQTKTWPWEMAILHYVTVTGMQEQHRYPDGSTRLFTGKWADGQPLRQELWLHPNGMPSESGICAEPEGFRLGTWKRWNSSGIPIPDTTYLIPFSLLAYLPGGGYVPNPVCSILTGGQHSTPWSYMHGGTSHLWLPRTADTLVVSNGKFKTILDLGWFLRQPQPSASVHLMLHESPYVVMNHIPVPFTWIDSCYGILWEPELSIEEIQTVITALQKAFPYLKLHHQHHQQWYVEVPTSATDPAESLFPNLIHKYPIKGFSRCVAGAFGHSPAWFSGSISIQVIVPMRPEDLTTLASRYNCSLAPSSPGSGYWTLNYLGSLLDDSFPRMLNRLSTEPGLGVCVPEVVMYFPKEPLWDE